MTGLGPLMTGGRIADDTPLQIEGLYPRQRAVEIYGPASADVPRPGQAGLKPVADTAVVSGGPEALLPLSADPTLRDRATVLTGDNHPGLGTPPLQVVGDGLRRADTRFGLVNANTSYTYTPRRDATTPAASRTPASSRTRSCRPTGIGHQTVAELRGARSVTASSSGNWLFHLPQYDPVNAFDGNPDTAWAEGAAGRPGRAVAADRLHRGRRTCPPRSRSPRCRRTSVRVGADPGAGGDGTRLRTSTLRPDGTKQQHQGP